MKSDKYLRRVRARRLTAFVTSIPVRWFCQNSGHDPFIERKRGSKRQPIELKDGIQTRGNQGCFGLVP